MILHVIILGVSNEQKKILKEFMEGLISYRGFWSFVLFVLVLDQLPEGREQVLIYFMRVE